MKFSFLKFIFLLPFLVNFSYSQDIFGKIELEDQVDLEVLITIKPINFNLYSEKNGNFIIPKLPTGEYLIEFHSIGYKKEVRKIIISDNEKIELNVKLFQIPFLLNEVVVTGTHEKHLLKDTPVITEIIKSEDIQQFNTQTLAEVLPLQTGIDLTQSIGQTQNIKLQGLKKNQVLILVDGERVTGKVDDAIDVGQFPVSNIEKIEIVKGPLSSIYGTDAIGGVVNIITKQTEKKFNYSFNSTYGSFNRIDFGFHVGNGFKFFDKIDYSTMLSANMNKFDGIDYDASDFITELPSFTKKYLLFKNNFNFKNNFIVNIKNEILNENNSWLAGGSKWVYFKDFSTNDKFSTTLNSKYFISEKSFLNLTLNNSENIHTSSEETNSGFKLRDESSTEKISSIKLNSHFSPYTSSFITIGIEKNYEELISSRILSNNKLIKNDIIYFEDEWKLLPVILNFGGRYSDNSSFGKFFAPRISLLYQANPNFSFRSSYGKGFRAPSINELFINFNHASVGYKIEGNPLLLPENSNGFNFGFDYSRDDLVWFRINYFQNDVKNLIEYYNKPNTSEPVVITYHNIESTKNSGLDLDIDYRQNENFKINFGYNYISTSNDKNEPLLFQSPNTVVLKINYNLPIVSTSLFFLTKWVDIKTVSDEQYNSSNYKEDGKPNYKTIPSHFVINSSITNYKFENFKFSIGINNLLNVKHYPFGQSKPREMYISLNYSTKN